MGEGAPARDSLDGWKPHRAAENDNEQVDLAPLQQEGPEADAVRKEMHTVMAELMKRQAVSPEVHNPDGFARKISEEIAVAEESTRRAENLNVGARFDRAYNNADISEKLPGYGLMTDMVREDVAAEEGNIENLDAARKRARKAFGVE